jgi:hypothetical protein
MYKYFDIVKTPEDLFENRMLAFTNKSVGNLNKIIRRKLYQTEVPFINDEVLVMQEPLMRTHKFEGKSFTDVRFNNGELVRVLSCQPITKRLAIRGIDQEDVVKCWHLELRAIETDVVDSICVIEDERQMKIFQHYLSAVAYEFKNSNTGKRPNWSGWWDLRKEFHKVKALPCGTIHKSQGTSVDNVFLYTPCIHSADADLAQQLLYVGATRARNNVYFV